MRSDGYLMTWFMKMAQLYKIICDDEKRVGNFVSKLTNTDEWAPFRAIGLERKGKLVAGVVYDNYNGTNIFAHIAAKGKYWLNKDFLWYMCYYPFIVADVDRVTGMIPSNNKQAIKFVEHLGGEYETTLEKAHPEGDLLIYRMFKKDCKYLRKIK